jgi:hypothetical protein
MRAVVDLFSHMTSTPLIVQVEQTPAAGSNSATTINGKYLLPIVKGAEFPIDSNSYVLDVGGDVDGGDISSISYAYLLAMYPQFEHVYFNPLLTAAHVGELDLTTTFKEMNAAPPYGPSPPNDPIYYQVRAQTGRAVGDAGQMPTHTALLPINNSLTPGSYPRPGLMITDEIDIGPYTLDSLGNPVGADQFLLYWKLYDFSVSSDVAADVGALAGHNDPAIRTVLETDQEPTGFSAYISPDNGDHWCEVGLLEPVAFCSKTTKVRLAFMNTSSSKVYIATYGVLF